MERNPDPIYIANMLLRHGVACVTCHSNRFSKYGVFVYDFRAVGGGKVNANL